jgi:hypothetical protein
LREEVADPSAQFISHLAKSSQAFRFRAAHGRRIRQAPIQPGGFAEEDRTLFLAA